MSGLRIIEEHEWETLENFIKSEFDCKHTGENEMSLEFLIKLQALRYALMRAMSPSSGYRANTHPVEARKAKPGWHSAGRAVDIRCHSDFAWDIAKVAMQIGFHGIGVSQKNGIPRFIHLDDRPFEERALYSY